MPVGQRLSCCFPGDDLRGRRRAPSSSSSTRARPLREGEPANLRPVPRRAESESQEELVLACLRGEDREAFQRLHERFHAAIYRICLRVTGSAQDAEDAAQDTFLVVHEKLSTFRFQARFSSWIFRVAYNKAVELRRSRRRSCPESERCS